MMTEITTVHEAIKYCHPPLEEMMMIQNTESLKLYSETGRYINYLLYGTPISCYTSNANSNRTSIPSAAAKKYILIILKSLSN